MAVNTLSNVWSVHSLDGSTAYAYVESDGTFYISGDLQLGGTAYLAAGLTMAGALAGPTSITSTGTILGTNTSDGTAIADPGDGAAVPVTSSGVCALTSDTAAETRTLAIPTRVGQVLDLVMDVDGGGDIVVTVAAAVNVTGNNTLTLDNAGEHISLRGVQVGGALVWRVLANDGVALTTV